MPDHPDFELLISYASGELPADRAEPVARHIEHCETCRGEVLSLSHAMEPPLSAGNNEAELNRLLGALRDWRGSAAGRQSAGPGLNARVAEQLAPYLGAAGAGALLDRVSPGGEDMLAQVEAVLALFLGTRAANSLVSRVVDKAIVGS